MFMLVASVYVNVCRAGTVTVTGQYQYPDNLPGDEDAFAREPFVVRFRAPGTGECTESEKFHLRYQILC